jgi:hypothetical protein
MNLDRYVESIQHQLEVAADAGGEEARALAERLVAPLDSAIRLALQEALAAATEEITLELAPGSVELRLRGREPEFVVTLPPVDPSVEDVAQAAEVLFTGWRVGTPASGGTTAGEDVEEVTVSRINLRLPERLKSRIEEAADAEGLSVNSWLVRTAATAVERRDPVRQRDRRTVQGLQRYTGWAR